MRIFTTTFVALCLSASAAFAADAGHADFLAGLDAMSNADWKSAAGAFGKAVAADDENAVYHLDLGVVLTLAGDSPAAKKELNRAGKLDPRNGDVLAWSFARLQMYESTAFGGSPPYEKTPYARKLCDSAIFYGTPRQQPERDKAFAQIVTIAKEFAWNQLGKGGADAMSDRVVALYKAGKFQDCLDLIDKLRAAGPLGWQLIGYSAHCKLGLGDFPGARDEYTIALRAQPATASYLIGRAKCELSQGCLRDADSDFALSRQLDATLTDNYVKDCADLFADAKARAQSDPPAVLWANLKQAAADNKPETQLVALAGQLIRVRNAGRYMPAEEYTRELTRLQTALNADAKSATRYADVAAFLLDPAVRRKVSLPHVDASTRIPCGSADPTRARAYLVEALKFDASNVHVMEQAALLNQNVNNANDMIAWVQKALDAGALTLDLATMHLDYYTNLADGCANQAAALRQPTMTSETHQEGDRMVTNTTTTPPTPAALAQAAQLDQQSSDARRRAVKPLQMLAEKLKPSADAADRLTLALVNAHYDQWGGKYADAIAAAQAALKIDPYDLDALTFLIDLCPKVGQGDLAIQYQDLMNNVGNPSSGRTLDKIWPEMKATRFKTAREILAKAEAIDPGAPHAANAAFAIAQEQGNLDEALVSGRIILALEQARVAGAGRSLADDKRDPLSGSDAAVSVYVQTALAKLADDAGGTDDVIDHATRAAHLTGRVPQTEWNTSVPETITPNDPGQIGNSIATLNTAANRFIAYKRGSAGRPNAELADIDAQLQKIDREIQHGVGPDEQRDLESKRDALEQKRDRILNARKGK